MKYVWRIAFLALILIPIAQVHADTEVVKKHSSKLRAFENLDARLKHLDSYKVVYVAADGSEEVIKSGSARQIKKDELRVDLIAKQN